jgi:hypothetical protein
LVSQISRADFHCQYYITFFTEKTLTAIFAVV